MMHRPTRKNGLAVSRHPFLVLVSQPTLAADRIVDGAYTWEEAKRTASQLNREAFAREGRPKTVPFPVYYARARDGHIPSSGPLGLED
jgi:hypothetical protein